MDKNLHKGDKLHTDNRGYSLIELIIVFAIIAVLMGTVFYSIILVFSANAKIGTNNIQRSIGDCKVTTMGKADAYMELYRDSEGSVYTKMYITESDGTSTEGEPQKVGSSKVEVRYVLKNAPDNDPGTLLMPDHSIKIQFDRSNGGFKADAGGVIYREIYVRGGSKNYCITMVELTGKSEVAAKPMPAP